MALSKKGLNTALAGHAPVNVKKPPKRLIMVIAVIFIVLAIAFIYLGLTISAALKNVPPPTQAVAYFPYKPVASVGVISQQLLSYDEGARVVPYILLHYNASNVSSMTVSINLYQRPPPSGNVYILNWTNQCVGCSGFDINAMIRSLDTDLVNYSVISPSSSVQLISPQQLPRIQNNSVVLVVNGRIPDYLVNNYTIPGTSTSMPMLDYLMERGITVFYFGRNFSQVIAPQGVLQPDGHLTKLTYLQTSSEGGSAFGNFSNPTFSFSSGQSYGAITYETVGTGAIVAFSNYLNKSWSTPPQAAFDIATAMSQGFWVPSYVRETYLLVPPNEGGKNIRAGLALPDILASGGASQFLNSSYERITVVITNGTSGVFKGAYHLLNIPNPRFPINGTISMPSIITPTRAFNATMRIASTTNETGVAPYLDIYDQNMTLIESIPPFFSKNIPANYSFIIPVTLAVGPGSYVAQLDGSLGQHYATAYFTVLPISLTYVTTTPVINGTYSFIFRVTSGSQDITGTQAYITDGGQYGQTVNITNGTAIYTLKQGQGNPNGNQQFAATVLNYVATTSVYFTPVKITINKQYIEFIVVFVIVLLEVTVVKAPVRDEFYIDVPSMPPPARIAVKIKENEAMSVFDRLNMYYHWRFMPLTKTEFRTGIANSVRYNNMPVSLTYNNIETILDTLVSEGKVIEVDGLYAPKTWIDQSKHDIGYLATFKKLRVYLVAHGHIFTDLDRSEIADIVTTLKNEKAYIIITSPTSRFAKVPVYKGVKTYMAFLNAEAMEQFRERLNLSASTNAEELKMYLAVGYVQFIDADNPEGILMT
jgi:hypothetical protein